MTTWMTIIFSSFFFLCFSSFLCFSFFLCFSPLYASSLSRLFLFSSHLILLMIWSTHHHSFILSFLSESLLSLLSFILLLTFNSFTTSLTDQWSKHSFFFLSSFSASLIENFDEKMKSFHVSKKLQLKYKNFSNVNDGKETKRWIFHEERKLYQILSFCHCFHPEYSFNTVLIRCNIFSRKVILKDLIQVPSGHSATSDISLSLSLSFSFSLLALF